VSGARPIRAYLDTSAFGGCFDAPFAPASNALFDAVRNGRVLALLGATTLAELRGAPEQVREVLAGLAPEHVFLCPITPEVVDLRDAYLDAGVLGPSSIDDATHVATAAVHDADVLVSWNFKHIVNFGKIRLFNAVNIRLGYNILDIRSPQELQYAGEP